MREKLSAPSMPVLCAKYLGGTKHLTLEQHGAMMLLLMITWENDGEPIRDDPSLISRYLSITKDRWLSKIRPELAPLFDLSEGTWKAIKPLNLGKQWAYVQDQIAVRQKNGRESRGRPPAIKFDEVSENFSAPTHEKITETQTANPLINNNVVKAPGYVPDNRDETYININIKKEESKKESPLTPQGGNGYDFRQIREDREEPKEETQGQGRVTSETVYRSQEPNRTLFPVQEVHVSPKRSKRMRDWKEDPALDELWAEFKASYPPRGTVNPNREGRKVFEMTLSLGISADEIISGAKAYASDAKRNGYIGTSTVRHYATFLNSSERLWEQYIESEKNPHKTNSKVTPLRKAIRDQVPDEYIRRGGRQG